MSPCTVLDVNHYHKMFWDNSFAVRTIESAPEGTSGCQIDN